MKKRKYGCSSSPQENLIWFFEKLIPS
jgi:hypothetical protein